MQSIALDPQPRETGKKATKAVRNAGLVPCVLYGAHTEPVHFAVETLQLRPLIFTAETYRVGISMDGEDHEAIVKETVFHPITDAPIHVDFLALTAGEPLTMTIPIRLEGTARGVKAGGILSQPLNDLTIRALPKDIPGHVSIDISSMDVGESMHISDLAFGDAIELITDEQLTVATVTAPRALVEDEPEEEALDPEAVPATEMGGGADAPDEGDET